jgi:hypothetical protein
MLTKNIYDATKIKKIYHDYKNIFSVDFILNEKETPNIKIVQNNPINASVLIDYFVDDIRYDYIQKKNNIDLKEIEIEKETDFNKKELIKDPFQLYFKWKKYFNNMYLKYKYDILPIYIPLSLYHIFKPKNVLDTSLEWGEKLLSNIMYNVGNFTGLNNDANLNLIYGKIIEMYNNNKNKTKNKYTIINQLNLEQLKLNEMYDMIIMTKPYYEFIKSNLEYGGFIIFIDQVANLEDLNLSLKFVHEIMIVKHKIITIYQKLPQNKSDIIKMGQLITNKKPYIEKINAYNKTFNIIRDDLLIGGSKQRFILEYLDKIKEHNIFYRGPVNGYAQIAIAYGCFLLGKQCHIIINRQYDNKLYKLTFLAKIFNAEIHLVEKAKSDSIEQLNISNILSKYENKMLLPLGLKSDIDYSYVYKDIFKINPRRMWVVGSTGTILKILQTLFPTTIFNVVIVSEDNYLKFKNKPNLNIFLAPQKYRVPVQSSLKPPYPSELSYDGKIWQFIKDNGKDDDYIYNIGGIL